MIFFLSNYIFDLHIAKEILSNNSSKSLCHLQTTVNKLQYFRRAAYIIEEFGAEHCAHMLSNFHSASQTVACYINYSEHSLQPSHSSPVFFFFLNQYAMSWLTVSNVVLRLEEQKFEV